MKKTLTIVLSALLISVLFVACNPDALGNLFGNGNPEPPSGLFGFEALEERATVGLVKQGNPADVTFQYSTNGATWQDYSLGKTILLPNVGDKVYFRAKGRLAALNGYDKYYSFSSKGNVSVEGDIMYLLNPSGAITEMPKYAFANLFNGNTDLVSAKDLVLPAAGLTQCCYLQMFKDCSKLTDCPELKATVLAASCYHSMFQGCSSLAIAPKLPATTLADNCYESMFLKCTLLETAPVLPATTLANKCYNSMFASCTSLETAPVLPAKNLVTGCYQSMFSGCSSLDSVTMLAEDISATNCLNEWLNDVAETGTFKKAENCTPEIPTGSPSGIPSGWTSNSVYSVTFDWNGIEGTTEAQVVEENGKITEPSTPTDNIHTFDGWYKTKDNSTGKLSNPWNFESPVTENITLYAQWTRTMESILSSNQDIPKSNDTTPPTDAWVKGDCRAFIGVHTDRDTLIVIDPNNPSPYLFFGMEETLKKVGDDYIDYDDNGYSFTCHMVNERFVSAEYANSDNDYMHLVGTYTAPYVEIAAKYDGNTTTTLKWYRQNLAITASGNKAWKGSGSSAVTVPGTNEKVIVGDYFQWAAYAGYSGDANSPDKGLLLYTTFTNTGCVGDSSNNLTCKEGKNYDKQYAPYYSTDTATYKQYNSASLVPNDDVAHILLGGNWHIPTSKEFQAMIEATYWAWDDTDNGFYVYNPKQPSDAGKRNSGAGSYNKSDALLFFPAAGYCSDNNQLQNETGNYWTSTPSTEKNGSASSLIFKKTVWHTGDSFREYGYSVRPVSE